MGEGDETIGLVKSGRALPDRVDHHQPGDAAPGAPIGALEGIGEQEAAKPLALTRLCHSQPPQERGGHEGVSRNVLTGCERNITWPKRGSAQGVVTKNSVRIVRRNKYKDAVGHASHILTRLTPQIAVETFHATGEASPVVIGAERLDF